MEEDKVYIYALVLVLILLQCYQQPAVALEYADTADSCKEQAGDVPAVTGSKDGCRMFALKFMCFVHI